MTVLTVADIDRWNAESVRQVFHAAQASAQTSFHTAEVLASLPAFESWGGDAADAAGQTNDEIRRELELNGDEKLVVGRAAANAADGIDKVKADLAALRDDAESLGLVIDPVSNQVLPGPGMAGASPIEAELKMMQLQPRLDAILADANQVDDELARAIDMADGDQPIPDFSPEAVAEPLPEDPEKFNERWEQLTEAEKDWLYEQDHFVGNHPGMPFLDKDKYNRRRLGELISDTQAEIDRLAQEHPAWAAGGRPVSPNPNPPAYREWKQRWDAAHQDMNRYKAVQGELQSSDGVPRLLGLIDDEGHAAVSMGNPDTATRNATFVPGTGQDLTRLEFSAEKSEQMYLAAMRADPNLQAGDVSVTTWMGYDRPLNLFEAASPGYARDGGDDLAAFQAGMRASHEAVPSIDTVIGHSYGSTLMGAAALDGNHLDVNNVVAVGSPGILAAHASDLSLASGANVFASRAENDMIGVATYATLGPDPMNSRFGGIPFEAAPGAAGPFGTPTVDAHSSYWSAGNPALDNMGRIIAGRTDVTPPTFTP
ncbi:alpha/beta hydrolase [Mycolicibacterium elephantis]|uniref:alpha/beta hydrolase n=1 Tax=Mycolicibacterium elephantis TaxID=81858 RepID=UPI003A8C51A4